jgi:hypothetical protein
MCPCLLGSNVPSTKTQCRLPTFESFRLRSVTSLCGTSADELLQIQEFWYGFIIVCRILETTPLLFSGKVCCRFGDLGSSGGRQRC